jgi:hypothetical protein
MRSGRIMLDCGRVKGPTAATIDQIARLQLAARRCSCELALCNANPDLVELIGFVGLGEVLGVEPGRKAKQRKEPRSVQEEGELRDPPAR